MNNISPEKQRELEKKSSAISLSDMEMFIFPDLIFSLVLANIMSPILWRWRDDPWFTEFNKRGSVARINRLKQYIMDHYTFNLDLETWGLTTQEKELARFNSFIDRETLSKSNALFGYEGDKYYFDIDIRRHFGLDKYNTNVIPYWKTETLEAMTAFSKKPGYNTGAGECVSLAALYAAALFVVLDIPLEQIYLMATPLHSQNFVDLGDGIITNNRRIVTKNMWFNGTELSAQARRAIEHENITFVTHCSGWIHTIYDTATISKATIESFSTKLTNYLATSLTPEILGNFLRQYPEAQNCFVVKYIINGHLHYLPLSRAFAYERDTPFKVTDNTRQQLLATIDQEEMHSAICQQCIVLDDLENYLRQYPVDINSEDDIARLEQRLSSNCINIKETLKHLIAFCKTTPRLPKHSEKQFISQGTPLGIVPGMSRDEIIKRVYAIKDENEYCKMALYAWRDLRNTELEPFIKAALERNPVCIEATQEFVDDTALCNAITTKLTNESIYEETFRLAQPDEVWNYQCGDGLEQAIMLATILKARNPDSAIEITIANNVATLTRNGETLFTAKTQKTISTNLIKF